MTRFNSTFRGSTPSTFNACVGNNGSPDYWDYAAGFSQAADVLINQVLIDPIEHQGYFILDRLGKPNESR